MNTALTVHNEDTTGRFMSPSSSTTSSIRLVAGVDASPDTNSGHDLDSGTNSSVKGDVPGSQSVAAPEQVKMLKPQLPPVSDIEHYAAQIDVNKVLLIPAGVTIEGDISTKGLASLVISGIVNGCVDAGAGSVIVRESGEVNGMVKSDDSVIVAGAINNPAAGGLAIATAGLWILTETGRVRGDVAYARHRAYEGAVFSGRAIPFSEYKA